MVKIFWSHKTVPTLIRLVQAFGPEEQFGPQEAKKRGVSVAPIHMAFLRTEKMIRRIKRERIPPYRGYSNIYCIPFDVHKTVTNHIREEAV